MRLKKIEKLEISLMGKKQQSLPPIECIRITTNEPLIMTKIITNGMSFLKGIYTLPNDNNQSDYYAIIALFN